MLWIYILYLSSWIYSIHVLYLLESTEMHNKKKWNYDIIEFSTTGNIEKLTEI